MIELKYENGRDLFPERLLKQIQKYVSGKLVYIPSSDKKRAWGETSGYKQYLIERNRDIKSKFNAGASVEQLADEYYKCPYGSWPAAAALKKTWNGGLMRNGLRSM